MKHYTPPSSLSERVTSKRTEQPGKTEEERDGERLRKREEGSGRWVYSANRSTGGPAGLDGQPVIRLAEHTHLLSPPLSFSTSFPLFCLVALLDLMTSHSWA
jgi:hypothetical protein